MNANQIIKFNKQEIPVFFHDNKPYVAMKPICENIGLQWEAQYKKIQRNHILNTTMSIIDMVAKDGKNRQVVCLPIGYLNGWLMGIDVNRVKPEIKPTLIKYQLECYDVLYNYFMPKVAEEYPNSYKPKLDVIEILQDFVEQVIVTNHEMKKLCDAVSIIDNRVFMTYAQHLLSSNELARKIAWQFDFKNKSGEPTIDMYCRNVALSNGRHFEVKPNWFNCQA